MNADAPSVSTAGAAAWTSSASGSLDAVRGRARRRRLLVVSGVLLLGAVVAAASLSLGDYPLPPADLWRTLWGGGERIQSYVVFQVRLPRLLMALLVGACLAVAGALLQTLLRNPLASPDLLGVSGGAGAAAVLAMVVWRLTGPGLAFAAFAGGVGVAAFLLLAGHRRVDGGYRLILAGIGVSFLSVSVTSFLLVRAQLQLAQDALVWLTGSLSATTWASIVTVALVAVAALPIVVLCARWLPITQLGTATAISLGVRTGRVRLLTVGAAVLLVAVTCAFTGPISFIALCAPAIARPLIGHGGIAVGTSAGIGAVLLASADLVAQFAIPGRSVPVGVVTGAIGAVFLLWLLSASKGRTL
ncbi:iron chelate uptake ABC transporter family permease subunit [Microbacterium sp. SORGH_AS_0888]|uniref:FecCD family ABC transporter permease n=1 Tax=Microbacterium sp. SORGH_AS_0888 TaxID=3041791 RepID=UPI0027832BAF|nr:iron ABC transporter permease [Microbacterium sp. SORGH_AS_0888]MDQ1128427.1 iron complex transport system permease protein [Microbacterium sp. SORGH_AS_0888]